MVPHTRSQARRVRNRYPPSCFSPQPLASARVSSQRSLERRCLLWRKINFPQCRLNHLHHQLALSFVSLSPSCDVCEARLCISCRSLSCLGIVGTPPADRLLIASAARRMRTAVPDRIVRNPAPRRNPIGAVSSVCSSKSLNRRTAPEMQIGNSVIRSATSVNGPECCTASS